MPTVSVFVEDLIKKNKALLFSYTTCQKCQKTKEILKRLKIQYFSLELDVKGCVKLKYFFRKNI
jgi:hypothetical protein